MSHRGRYGQVGNRRQPDRFYLSEYELLFPQDTATTVTVTPGNNSMGSWADLYTTPLTGDYHGIRVCVSGVGVGGLAKNGLANVGWDPAGGTNYGASALTTIPYLDIGYAGPVANSWVDYFIPVLIPGGSTIGMQAQVNNATVGRATVWIVLYKAKRPRDAIFGTQVVSFGENTGTSRGVDVTVGQGSEGNWTLHTSSLAKPTPSLWFASISSANGSTISGNVVQNVEIAFGSSTANLRSAGDRWYCAWVNTSEQKSMVIKPTRCQPADGDNIYARTRSGNATTTSVMVHGII